jgi:hypothetical protein
LASFRAGDFIFSCHAEPRILGGSKAGGAAKWERVEREGNIVGGELGMRAGGFVAGSLDVFDVGAGVDQRSAVGAGVTAEFEDTGT